jgi:hypothetical protein
MAQPAVAQAKPQTQPTAKPQVQPGVSDDKESDGKFKLPPLPYDYKSLEPHIRFRSHLCQSLALAYT